jgi:glycosyltransferase involved in cell wall biosynthesis
VTIELSVIIPAHNPRRDYLARVLEALRAQTLPQQDWELLIVDNQSDPAVESFVDLHWHSRAKVVREHKLGLTCARVRGFSDSSGKIVVLVDDDNVLAPDFLEAALTIAREFPFIGTWGGCIVPEYEQPSAAPPSELDSLLTLRQVSYDMWSNDPDHHASTPWGAGLCVRRAVAEAYCREVAANANRASLDLKGGILLYGGDTDIAYTGCRMGFAKGVFTRLHVTHLIPANRCTADYLCRVAHGRGYSEVLHGYALSGVVPSEEPLSLAALVRQFRTILRPRLLRSIAFAHRRGRQKAFQDLTVARDRL